MGKKNVQSKSPAKSACVIDISSNKITVEIGQAAKGRLKIIESLTYPLKLGTDTFSTGKISFEKADKACEIIKNFLKVASEYGAEAVKIVATTAISEAENKDYILDQIRLKTGVSVDVIDSQEEKFYIYKLMHSLLSKEVKQSAMLVFIGLGSLGISVMEKERITFTQNIRIGSLRLSEMFENVQEYSREFHILVEEYLESFTDGIGNCIPEGIRHFAATGNDIALIARLCGAEQSGGMFCITKDSFYKLYADIKFKTVNRISTDYKITMEQSELLLPALCIYGNLFEFTQAELILSPMVTLSEAVLSEILCPEEFAALNKEFYKSTILSAKFTAKRFGCNEAHYSAVENFSLKIFDKIRKIHGLGVRERLLLQTAAILHDSGKFINIRGHYKRSYDIICGLDLIGLSVADMEIIASLALYHSRFTPKADDDNYKKLKTKDRVTVSKLTAILRLADSLDRSHTQKFGEIDVKLTDEELVITVSTDRNIELENWAFTVKGLFFQEVFGIRPVLRKKTEL